MTESKSEFNWYVLKTKSAHEKKISLLLSTDGYTVYLPLVESIRQWSDRKKKIISPLIPSVVFVNCAKTTLDQLYAYTGIVGVLKYLKEPAIVKDVEIENLKIIEKEFNGEEIQVSSEVFEKGQRVSVKKGPFKGLIAESVKVNDKHRLLVKIELLNAEYIVNIPRSFVSALNN
jgi:transcription antitermination factor NusG